MVAAAFSDDWTFLPGSFTSAAKTGTILFAPGETSRTIGIDVVDDDADSNGKAKSLQLTLTPSPTYVLGNSKSFDLQITDNDRALVGFAVEKQTVWENVGNANVTIASSKSFASNLTFEIKYEPGGNTPGKTSTIADAVRHASRR